MRHVLIEKKGSGRNGRGKEFCRPISPANEENCGDDLRTSGKFLAGMMIRVVGYAVSVLKTRDQWFIIE